ncbi:MAG: DUF3180 domain-containing protein [Cellulomonadaceae bacterium]|jgi:hypothetical protein|nr:DUF3180 domain-containing protein [Cellulomonadaceae bacterium]
MKRTSLLHLLVIAAAANLIIFTVLRVVYVRFGALYARTWWEWVAILLLAGIIFWLGWTVRAYQKGKKPNLSGLRAMRTLVLAKAGSVTGAILVGIYTGGVGVIIDRGEWHLPLQHGYGINAIGGAVCGLVLTVASYVAERFCELPPHKPEDTAQRGDVLRDALGEAPA